MTPRHPAKFSDTLLPVLARQVDAGWRVLDPFAGTGRIHELGCDSIGVEIEPEWASMHPRTIVGNALALPFPAESFDAVVTSPAYGNRMADHHDAKERCTPCGATGEIDGESCPKCDGRGVRDYVRNTYRHALGRPLHDDNAGAMQWGDAYREFHARAWAEAARVTRRRLVVNVSDHIRGYTRQRVVAWHGLALSRLGLTLVRAITVPTPRNGFGQNGDARVESEMVLVYDK